MLPEWTVVGFSGHRKLVDPSIVSAAIGKVLDRIADRHGTLAAVSSVASGADTLFVEEVARRELPCLLVLPFTRVRFQKDFSPADWSRVQPLVEKATHVEEVAGEESNEGAYMEAGVMTADRADVMVAVWDGKPAAGFGGTGDVVSYLRELGKPLIVIDPHSGEIKEERLEKLPSKVHGTEWNGNPREAVEKHFLELDQSAQIHAPKSRYLVLRVIFYQLLASAMGSISSAFGIHGRWDQLLTLIQLLLLGFAFVLSIRHRRKHHEWMKKRIAAEICRSFLATWHIRQADYFPKISVEGFNRLYRNLQLLRVLEKTQPLSLETVRDRYLKERIENQIAYYSEHSAKSCRIHQTLNGTAVLCTAAATILSLLVFVASVLQDFSIGLQVSDLAQNIPKFLSLLLSLVSTAFISLLVTQDYSRRAIRYGEMVSKLKDSAARLKMVRTWNGLVRVAAETEDVLFQEIVEWHSFRQFAGEPH